MYHNNPNLKPETTWTCEAGIDQYLFDRKLKMSGTYFYTKAEDLIGSYKEGSDSYKENVGEADIQGIELEASVMPFSWLDIWMNYTYTDSEVKKNDRDPAEVGKHLTDYPEQTANVGCGLIYKWFRLDLVGNYTGRIYKNALNDDDDGVYGAYSKCWLWDAKLTCKPVEHIQCSLSVDNIFDREYFASDVGRERSYFFEIAFEY
jgi:iron complex outermembrane receptor protein